MTARPRLVIVNADDLGRTAGIDAGIFAAHRDGVVTSATLMVAYPQAVSSAAAMADHPELGVGLHVALTGGPSVLPPERIPSLAGDDGVLPRKPEDLDGADPAEILAEVRAQLARFRELTGRLPTHLDSHHHSHRRPEVLAAVLEVAREHLLPVRNASPEVESRLRAAGLPTTDAFVESFFAEATRVEDLLAVLAAAGDGSTEVMCHPAVLPDPVLAAASTYVADRARELATLTDPAVRDAVRTHGLRLGHFGHLPTP